MKNWKIHLAYGLVLCLVGFFYWKKSKDLMTTLNVLAHINKQTELDCDLKKKVSDRNVFDATIAIKAYPNLHNQLLGKKLSFVEDRVDSSIAFFTSIIESFRKKEGDNKLNWKTEPHFDLENVEAIRDSLKSFSSTMLSVFDSINQKRFIESMQTDKLISDSIFWQRFKYLNQESAIGQLNDIITKIRSDEISITHYFVSITNDIDMVMDKYMVSIVPRTFPTVEGDTFKADIIITAHLPYVLTDLVYIKVDDKPIQSIGSEATFEKQYFEKGKKRIFATAYIKNPLTGYVKQATPAEFEFEVLLKCRRDCN